MEPELPPDHAAPDQAPDDQPETPPAGHAPPDPPASGPGGSGVSPGIFQFLRSRDDKKLGGVAGGLAAVSGVDPFLARLAIVLGCLTGWGILAYLIAWAVIPKEDPAVGRYLVPAPEETAKYIRIGLIVAGAVGILHVVGAVLGILSMVIIGLGTIPAHMLGLGRSRGFDAGEAMLGLFLLLGGCVLLFRRHLPWNPAADAGSGGASWSSGWTGGGPATGPGGAGPSVPGAGMALATIAPGSGGSGATAGGVYGPPPPPSAGASGSAFTARATAAARAARTNGPLLLARATGWLVGLWFLAAAILGGVFWLTGALRVRFPVLPIVAIVAGLGVLGYTLLRSRRVAAVLGAMVLLLVPSGLAVAVTRVDGQAGDRSVTPTVMSDLQPTYRHAIGAFSLDLSRLQLPPGETRVDLDIGVGQIEVTVPWDANVEARASVTAGAFDLFGNRQTGVNLDGRTRSTGQPGAPQLIITGEAGAGEVIVHRGFEPFTQQALRTGQPVPMQCNPSSPQPWFASRATSPLRCDATDGETQTPALACVVSESGIALCRPPGEPEPAVDWANRAGTRRCQVPAGGGQSTCTAPIPGTLGGSPGGEGSFTCTIPEGGGESVCRPTGTGSSGGPAPAPAAPASPAPPAAPADPGSTTVTSGPSAPPGEYRCTVPGDGGPTTCEPA
jgi:phage shock protein PspC (stress-responsive transcriptional regulator)